MSLLDSLFKPDVDKLEAKGDISGLLKALEYQKDAIVRRSAAEALEFLANSNSVKALVNAAITDSDGSVRNAAIYALGQIKEVSTIELLTAAKNKNSADCSQIGEALINLSSTSVTSSREIRDAAQKALVNMGDSAIDSLIQALQNSNWNTYHQVVETLGEIKAPRTIVPLLDVIKNRYSYQNYRLMHRITTEALAKIGASGIELLISALQDRNHIGRYTAAQALGKIRNPNTVEPLIAMLKDEDMLMRKNAAEALGEIGDIRAVKPLIEVSADVYKLACRSAIEALGRIKDASAIEPLFTIFNSNDRNLRRSAAKALREFENMNSEPTLVSYWKKVELVTELSYAAGDGKNQTVKKLVNQGVDINEMDRSGELSLIRAVKKPATVSLLIELGADVNLMNEEGKFPLGEAVKYPDSALALINASANVNAQNSEGETALFLSATLGSTYVMKELIKVGADINLKNNYGDTPLLVGSYHRDSVKILVEAGADVSIKNNQGITALQEAQKNPDKILRDGIVNYLLGRPEQKLIGWMVTEKWGKGKVISGESRRKIQIAVRSLKDDMLVSIDMPSAVDRVYGKKKNAERIATLLRKAECPEVDVHQIRYDTEKMKWI